MVLCLASLYFYWSSGSMPLNQPCTNSSQSIQIDNYAQPYESISQKLNFTTVQQNSRKWKSTNWVMALVRLLKNSFVAQPWYMDLAFSGVKSTSFLATILKPAWLILWIISSDTKLKSKCYNLKSNRVKILSTGKTENLICTRSNNYNTNRIVKEEILLEA